MEAILSFLSSHPFFYHLTKKDLLSFVYFAKLRELELDERLFSQGEVNDTLYLIVRGSFFLRSFDGSDDEVFVDTRMYREFLSENIVEGESVCPYTASALEPSTVICFDGLHMREVLKDFPKLMDKFIRISRQSHNQINFLKHSGREHGFFNAKTAFPAFTIEPSLPYLLSKLNMAIGGEKQINHCKSVAFLAREMARFLCPVMDGLLYWAGFLYEIGKLSLDYSTLSKINSGLPLSGEEEEQLKTVYRKSLEIISPDPSLKEQMSFILYMNEDSCQSMPLEAQILKVVKDFVALTVKLPRNEAISRMRSRGDEYNHVVLDTLSEFFDRDQNLRLNTTLSSIRIYNRALDKKDGFTLSHCDFVARISLLFAKKLELSKEMSEDLKLGAELHNVGMIEVPYGIINSPRILTDDEFELIKKHPLYLDDFISRNIPAMDRIGKFTRHHHENYDGSGYPYGLAGNEIPLLARVLRIADVYCALRTKRVYRVDSDNNCIVYDPVSALNVMKSMQPMVFDPELFDYFYELMSRKNSKVKGNVSVE